MTAHSPNPLLILIDGHSLAFRSYFAFAKGRDGGLRTKSGIPTSVTYGFLKALLEVIEAEHPDYLAIAFDKGETFRHEADATYKADRPDAPEDFLPDLLNLQELLTTLNLPVLTAPGYEADDIIGTLTRRATGEGLRVKILSGDRDLFQLVDDDGNTKVLYLSSTFARGNPPPKEFGVEEVKTKMGVAPAQVVDFKALCGDPSDNIPGVRGIGEKTAQQLLSSYGSLEGVYAAIDEIKGAVKKKLEDGKDDARHSQYMAQIHLNVPLDADIAACKLTGFDSEAVQPMLEKLEFTSLLGKVQKLQRQLSGEAVADEKSDRAPTPTPRYADSDDLWFFSAEDTAVAQNEVPIVIAPQIIDTPKKLADLVRLLKTHTETIVAWDTETSALEPRDAELVGIGCCWGTEPSEIAYIPVGHAGAGNLDRAFALEALRPILEDAAYPKALHNAKFDRLVLRCQGVALKGVVFDTMLASYVLEPEAKHSLSEVSRVFLKVTAQSFDELVPKGKTIADIEIPSVANYCGLDVYTTFLLVPKLREKLAEIKALDRLLVSVEQPLEPVLAQMEFTGVRIDRDYLKELSNQLEVELLAIEQRAYEAAGQKFSLGSPKQLSDLLFNTLKLDTKKSRKIKTGFSTDKNVLDKLQGDHPVVDAILESRTLNTLKSTFIDALPMLIRPDTQRVHTNFNQTGTSTGRLSSSSPNLQNIPIRTAFSRQIRKAFIPQDGWLLVGADYSQIELRILAHLSQEPALVETYRNNGDVHRLTARLLLEKEEISSEERRLAKIINFGVIYGMGAQRFAREAGVSNSTAREFIDRFNQRYAKVFDYLQQMQREAIAQGYVETILGRRRYFNFGNEGLKKLRGQQPTNIDLSKIKVRDQFDAGSLRAAANAPIQGSSADIIKIAMAKLHDLLQNYQARLLLQVHDELVFEMPPEEWPELQPQIQSAMESAVNLSVPLLVEIRSGENWMETK